MQSPRVVYPPKNTPINKNNAETAQEKRIILRNEKKAQNTK